MGSGLAGGPLTGGLTTAALPPAPAGQSAVLSGPLGAAPGDIVTKAGGTVADAAINANAVLLRVGTGIGGTETASLDILKNGLVVGGGALLVLNNTTGARLGYGAATILFGATASINGSVGTIQSWTSATGLVSHRGTDSSGTPGAATIDKPSGKSAIAAGQASVVITNALVTAASRVIFSPETRDATCKELIAVPGAGSFTVSGSAVATATLVFSWEVSNIL